MKNINVADMTLCRNFSALSFKEKIEIVRQLEKLNVNAIELPAIENKKTDILLVRTISSFVKNSIISVATGMTVDGVELASEALSGTAKPRIRIELPLSPVGMEYTCHKKPAKMIELIGELIAKAKSMCKDVEFCAVDATRAEEQFLIDAISAAVSNGANVVTVCDTAAEMMPDEFAGFVENIKAKIPAIDSIELGICCENKNGMANAASLMSLRKSAETVKTAVLGGATALETFAETLKNCGNTCGLSSLIKYTELNRIIRQISRIIGKNNDSDIIAIAEHMNKSLSIKCARMRLRNLAFKKQIVW